MKPTDSEDANTEVVVSGGGNSEPPSKPEPEGVFPRLREALLCLSSSYLGYNDYVGKPEDQVEELSPAAKPEGDKPPKPLNAFQEEKVVLRRPSC